MCITTYFVYMCGHREEFSNTTCQYNGYPRHRTEVVSIKTKMKCSACTSASGQSVEELAPMLEEPASAEHYMWNQVQW